MRKISVCVAVLAMVLVMVVGAQAQQTVTLKGSGSSFKDAGWTNTFVAAPNLGETPSVWHLVYAGQADFNNVWSMELVFTNGEVFSWDFTMGPSLNGGGNNPGWVVFAPFGWEIAYGSLVTFDTGNVNFNISGFTKGAPDADDEHVCVFDKADYNGGNPYAMCDCGEYIDLVYDSENSVEAYNLRIGAGSGNLRNALDITITEVWGDFGFSFAETIWIPNQVNAGAISRQIRDLNTWGDSRTWVSVTGNVNNTLNVDFFFVPAE